MIKPTVERRWIEARDAITAEASRFSTVECRIPRWEPTGLDEALRWVRGRIYEAWYVAWRSISAGDHGTLQFKYWEYGEPEPAFEELPDFLG